MHDIIVIGAGPAGVSAALTARARGKDVALVSNAPAKSPLARAERIDNYPGLARIGGVEFVELLTQQIATSEITFIEGRVVSVLPFGEMFMASVGQDVLEGHTLILAVGAAKGKQLDGEERLLGRGVSYCATCDGMLYRGRAVCVVGDTSDAFEEALFLAGIGCTVTFVSRKSQRELGVHEDAPVTFMQARVQAVIGDNQVEALVTDKSSIPCDAVFVLRPSIAPAALFPGLEIDGSYIKVDHAMSTNIAGVFAAGDCTGKPLQIAKAVGEGQIAAFSAIEWLERTM